MVGSLASFVSEKRIRLRFEGGKAVQLFSALAVVGRHASVHWDSECRLRGRFEGCVWSIRYANWNIIEVLSWGIQVKIAGNLKIIS